MTVSSFFATCTTLHLVPAALARKESVGWSLFRSSDGPAQHCKTMHEVREAVGAAGSRLQKGWYAFLPATTLRQRQQLRGRGMLSEVLDLLDRQREEFGALIHRGVCQELTASNLLGSMLQVSPDQKEDKDSLLNSLARANTDLRRFLERQLGPPVRGDFSAALGDLLVHYPELHGDPIAPGIPLNLAARASLEVVRLLGAAGLLQECVPTVEVLQIRHRGTRPPSCAAWFKWIEEAGFSVHEKTDSVQIFLQKPVRGGGLKPRSAPQG